MSDSSSFRYRITRVIRKIIAIIVFVVTWQILVSNNVMSPLMFGNLPSPVEVGETFIVVLQKQVYYYHILASFGRILAGSLAALPLAVFLGLIIGLSRVTEDLLLSIFDMLRPIPQISWIPVAILIFPSVEGSIIFITFLGAFFPILVNTIAGVANVNPSLIIAAKSMNATKLQLLRYVYLPGIIPNIFTGFTIGIGVSWMSVIAAEMISGKYGIGYYTWTSYTLMAYSETIIGMITIGAMGTVCFELIKIIEKSLLKWREEIGG
ncbi:Bicarbonate transport system permease protein CmpB [Sporomusa silvacetica DSM 10669]|uniref:Bicarbonate transport system permease protein CmpB n=1 Tax=Sporomusa silvacetica DSM 10669 TaxID=1123289 RepID=A0ABZ3ISS6_9FIRM|nr:ABC transporter permease [Sporomusa silvacetica]OZC15306.1 bicarbonate transport system permease protein CmpB [Sporomusa silvacetica DSM 10669]